MASYVDNPKHWRDRAEEARVQAEQMSTEDTRRMMLQIAVDYDHMAERAVQRIAEGRGLSGTKE
jgi:hypothetical protein